MTTKKKLIAIGAVAILTTMFVWNPLGNTNSLASRMIDGITQPTTDNQILPLTRFGSYGAADDKFYYPRGVAVYENKLFVTDWYNNRVKVVNKNTGAVIKIIGKTGSGNGEFRQPFDIEIDEVNKFFYVTDLNNDRVQKFNLETYAFAGKFGTRGDGPGNFVNPTGIAIDVANNRLYVSDYYCRVQRFELSTLQYRDSWGGTCGNGNNQFTRQSGFGPEAIEVDWAGNVYVADSWNNRIQKFNYKGEYLATIANRGTNGSAQKDVWVPMGLSIDKGGYLYVGDTYHHRIQKFDIKTAGNPLVRVYGSVGTNNAQLQYPRGIFVDKDSDIYIADTNNHRIQVFQQHIIVPKAPQGLQAVPNVAQVSLAWVASGLQSGTPILDYIVEYKKTSENTWTVFSEGIGTNTNATIVGLASNTDYQFRVYARNTAREVSDKSAIITKKTLADVAPKAPTSFVARVANGQINLSWAASSANGGAAVSDYIVSYRQTGTSQWNIVNDGVRITPTTADVTALTNGTSYDFRVQAKNTGGILSPFTAIISKTPNPDDKCNNINGIQTIVPVNTKRSLTTGACSCINEGNLDATRDPFTCTLMCSTLTQPVEPEFKIVYDEGFPRIYTNADDKTGTPKEARKIIISDIAAGTILNTNTWIPLFKANVQPFYDREIIEDANRISLQREGNTLRVLWYGNRNDDKIERVKGKIYIQGSPDIKWTKIVERKSVDESDKVVISESNDKVISFDMSVRPDSDSFVVRFDLGSRAGACIEKPLIIFNENATDATGTMSNKNMVVGTPAVLPSNTFNRPGYAFAGWNTKADGTGTNYANSVSYTMATAANVTLYAKWTANTYTVTFDGQSATTAASPATKTVTSPATHIDALPSAPERTGYAFGGWYTAINGGGTQFTATTPVSGNIPVYAKWTLNTAASCAGTLPTHAYQLVGYTGGTYTTWTYDAVDSGVHPSCSFACDSGYTYNSSDKTCTIPSATVLITYNANGATSGSVPAAQTKTGSNGITIATNAPTLIKTGYNFAGWNTQVDGNGTNYVPGTTYVFNVTATLYAKWISNDDADCDGVNDAWERLYGYSTTDNTVPSDEIDTDGDSYSDKNEGLFGSNPQSEILRPQYGMATENLENGQFDTDIGIEAFPGNKYAVEGSNDGGSNWSNIVNLPTGGLSGGVTISGDYTIGYNIRHAYQQIRVVGVQTGCFNIGCTGNLPANSEVILGPSESTVPSLWRYQTWTSGSRNICTFQCQVGYVYNNVTNTCNGSITKPTNISVLTTDRAASISWTAVSGATEYEIQYRHSGVLYSWEQSQSTSQVSTSSFTHITQLANGGDYLFRVRAKNTANNYISEWGVSSIVTIFGIGEPTGTSTVGQTLTAGTLVPSGIDVTYQWQRAGTATGSYTDITTSGTNRTYQLTAADQGKYIRVVITGTGTYTGTAISAPSQQVVAATNHVTTVTVPAIADKEYSTSAQTIALKATFANNVNTTINAGTVTFQVKDAGGTQVGSIKTETVSASSQEVTTNYTLLASAPVGTYTVIATYTPPTGSTSFVAGSGTGTFNIITNTTAPTVLSVSSSIPDGSYRAGTVIPILVTFSSPVIVTGIPTIGLETYNDRAVNEYTPVEYSGGSETEILTFNYTVIPGDSASDLNYAVPSSLKLKDSTVTINDSVTGVGANLTLPPTSDSRSLSGNKNIVIDTNRPAAPARPIVPQQANVGLFNGTNTYTATGSSIKVNIACTVGAKINIRDGVSFLPVTTVNCTTNPIEVTLNLSSQASYYNFFATVLDTAGNESDYSLPIIVMKQQTVNNAPGTPDLVALFDLGSSATDNMTSETRPEFTVACLSGSTVTLYNGTNTTPIGTGSCIADTAMITVSPALTAGTYSISAKQSSAAGVASPASSPLEVTIDTTPLNVTMSKASDQPDPSTSPSLKFLVTLSQPIDTNSFICTDVTVTNGICTSITTLTPTTYIINVTALTANTVRATIYSGRIQTVAGNQNTDSTGTNTIVYGLGAAPDSTNGQCSTTLKKLTTSKPTSTSLASETLCEKGEAGIVSYNVAKGEWGYICRGTYNGTNAVCIVKRSFDAAPTCTKKVVAELPFDSCTLNTSTMYNFQKYLSCLNVIPAKKSCADAGCTINAKRQELIYMAARMRGIPLDESTYDCQKNQNDTVKGVPSWVCEVAEKSQAAGLISSANKSFRPLDPMSRAEAYSVLMKTICVHPKTTDQNWQVEVARAAIKYGFTSRTVATFDPNAPILRQELWILTSHIAQWGNKHPDNCPELSDELLCE